MTLQTLLSVSSFAGMSFSCCTQTCSTVINNGNGMPARIKMGGNLIIEWLRLLGFVNSVWLLLILVFKNLYITNQILAWSETR